jgi:uncharacterized protein (DUF1800 family)
MAKTHPLLEPYEPSEADPFDAVKASHLLNRAGFGGTPEEVRQVVDEGPQGAVDRLLDFPDAGAEEQSQSDVPDLSSVEGYPTTYRELQKIQRGMTAEERMAYRQKLMQANRAAVAATGAWWVQRMAGGPYPLQEKLALFWHGHFTTSARDERSAALIWQQNELLRRQGAANFREFVRGIARDPAMLDYLNNQQNRKRHPNENFARELMELFTLGIGHYSENDIKEAARAFTGWGHDGDEFIFRRNEHDTDIKRFFGRSGNFDGDDIIEMILGHRACAPYIGSRIYRFFVSEHVPAELAQSMGELLRTSQWDMRPLLRTIFTSAAFYRPEVIGGQIKSPVQLVAGTLRLLDAEPPAGRRLTQAMQQMGQVPLEPPNVKGWPGGRSWINTSTLFVRYNTAAQFVETARTVRSVPTESPAEIVDAWLARLIQRPVADDKKRVLREALGGKPSSDGMKKMVQLIVSMPEYQLC